MELGNPAKIILVTPMVTLLGRVIAVFAHSLVFAIPFYVLAAAALAYAGWEAKEDTDSPGFGLVVVGIGVAFNIGAYFAL